MTDSARQTDQVTWLTSGKPDLPDVRTQVWVANQFTNGFIIEFTIKT
jgi:hypothetical protein